MTEITGVAHSLVVHRYTPIMKPLAFGSVIQRSIRTILAILVAIGVFEAPRAMMGGSSFTFTAVGDFGATTATDQVLAGIAASGADFHLALGDLSYGAISPESSWCAYVKARVGAQFAFELISGNHDMDGSSQGHIDNFAVCLPDRIGGLTGTYGKQYYFDHLNLARFILISPDVDLDGTTFSYDAGSTRAAWLAQAIDGARAAGIPWVIVGMHKNCISAGAKSCEIGPDLLNLLISKRVDLVLQGHDHNYQRSRQLAIGDGCAGVYPGSFNASCVVDDGADGWYEAGAGVVLAIVGTGGYSYYATNPGDAEAGYFAASPTPLEPPPSGFLNVKVTLDRLTAEFVRVNPNATFTDSFVIGSANVTGHFVPRGARWRYSAAGSEPGQDWIGSTFDDGGWPTGDAELGYGDGDEATVVPFGGDASNKHTTTYFRRDFDVAESVAGKRLVLRLVNDDGAAVYLNGGEVGRVNLPGSELSGGTLAVSEVPDEEEGLDTVFFIEGGTGAGHLAQGDNVIAAEVHLASPENEDMSFGLELTEELTARPGELASFSGVGRRRGRVRLKWSTAYESDLNGFHVYRSASPAGPYRRLTQWLISAGSSGAAAGGSYRWVDRTAERGQARYYRLELVATSGEGRWSDIVTVKARK